MWLDGKTATVKISNVRNVKCKNTEKKMSDTERDWRYCLILHFLLIYLCLMEEGISFCIVVEGKDRKIDEKTVIF